jgi:hypothetical protein
MDILNFLVILLTGFGGLFAHWYNRYVQGRTNNTFLEYLREYQQRTISSCLTILASEIALFQTTPPDLTLNAIFTAFTYGYTLDSIINREKLKTDETDTTFVETDTTFVETDATHTATTAVEETETETPKAQKQSHLKAPTPKPKKSLQEIIDETREH